MVTIVLTRHGHVEGIDPPRFRGRAELALTERGRRQVQATARRISAGWRVDAVYTSPMQRCIATGQAIAASAHVESRVLDPLNDIDYGDWQGRTHDEVRAASPELFKLWHDAPHLVRFPGGESLQDLVARAADALRLVLDRHRDGTVVLVGHDSVNRAMLLLLADQPLSAYWRLSQDPCGISEIKLGPDIRIRRVNETLHLDGIS